MFDKKCDDLDWESVQACPEVQEAAKALDEAHARIEEAVARGEVWGNTPIPSHLRLENMDPEYRIKRDLVEPEPVEPVRKARKSRAKAKTPRVDQVAVAESHSGDGGAENVPAHSDSTQITATTSPEAPSLGAIKRPRGRPRKRKLDEAEQDTAAPASSNAALASLTAVPASSTAVPASSTSAPAPPRQSKRQRKPIHRS